MPLRPGVPGLIKHQCMYFYTSANSWYVMTIWIEHPTTPTQAMADADRTVLTDWHTASWRANAQGPIALYQIKSWSMEPATPVKFTTLMLYPLSHITATGSIGAMGPAATCAISLRTGAVGALPKPPHGRIYHPGGLTGAALPIGAGGQLTAGNRDTLVGIYDTLRTAFTYTGSIGRWVVVSYQLGGTRSAPVYRAVPLKLPVSHVQADVRVDLVRRRLNRQQSYVTN